MYFEFICLCGDEFYIVFILDVYSNGLFQLLSAPPLLRNPFLMSVLPWNFRKFSCKIYPFPWNFLVKITLPHGISILD